jgi:hypothetical protein
MDNRAIVKVPLAGTESANSELETNLVSVV